MEKIIKAVSIDVEGCVTEPGGSRVPWPIQKMALLAPFLKLVKSVMGIRFFLNSGRQAPYIEAVLQALGLIASMPSIVENGAAIYFPDPKAFKLNPAITEEKLLAFQEVKKTLIKIMVGLDGLQELGKDFSFSTIPPVGMTIAEYFGFFRQELLKQAGVEKVIEMTHSQSAVDFTIKRVNKRTGLKFWCQETGIKLEELAGIGDSRGDLPVLEVVRMPMCPSNATKDVKELVRARGGYVSYQQTTLGVIDCVAHLTTQDPFIQETSKQIIRYFLLRHPIELYGGFDQVPL